ncbi:MFS transporter [Gluconobacter sphaericus]|uniref:MFS transporter n=1 Tax=Gluconobacter sphaericus NBRC 12467 TaxID=1307951 RepID=A0AA37SCY4_9PROT|nr:MFS transporter [Gluconobacter sphaericus]MBF0885865.1 MFS transporter [Gluconobacter sphaericus]QQX91594.1 MFS transporter [Gluconobacter sphaericus]GBR55242.1 major facilitator superfamily transporter [Gluconobacter sphaericus NBRC 12467]GEB43600.1 MFS transporter [Gluconobacter sphaericus NBRC 12467]GLQ83140.1 MFS transporter [Gluconobacter sphaericus NBRC 12467]
MSETRRNFRAVIGAIGGNALEWYDFAIFSYMIPLIGDLFFADSNHRGAGGLLLSTALFAVGFVSRPIGGIVLGYYGDRRGRQASMLLGMVIMAIAVAMMTCAPTYQQAGPVGAIMIAVARLLQGFSVGGEFATSTTFLVEMAPAGRRGFFGSWQITGQIIAQVLGGTVGYAMSTFFSTATIHAYAWRLPFALGLLIVPVVLLIRLSAARGAAIRPRTPPAASSFYRSFGAQWRQIAAGMGLVTASTVSFYIIYGYVVTYASRVLHLSVTHAYLVQMSAAASMLLVVPFSGYLSDRIEKRWIILAALASYLALIWPLYSWLLSAPSIGRLVVLQVALSVASGMFLGAYVTLITEILTPQTRTTMLAIVNNAVVMVVGGGSQFIVTWLITVTGRAMAPAFFVMTGVLIGVIAACALLISPSLRRPNAAS